MFRASNQTPFCVFMFDNHFKNLPMIRVFITFLYSII